MKKDTFGINMKRFCREHEAWVERRLESPGASWRMLEVHLEKLRWLQHERLVHLIVVVMTVLAELAAAALTLRIPDAGPVGGAVVLVLAVLLAFYFAHYFFLENTTQHWYRVAERIMDALEEENHG